LLAWRVVAAWLAVVSMLLGPSGTGMSITWAETCGVSCPCDDAHAPEDGEHAQHADDHDDAGELDDDHDEGPVDEDCPDDCPDDCADCGCSSGVMLAVVPLTVPSVQAPIFSLTTQHPPRAPAVGALFDVYRPPRSVS
jgi:hypothetical protein